MCDADRTCCPAGLEGALRQSAAHDFHRAVRQSSHHLRHSLAESASAIQGTPSRRFFFFPVSFLLKSRPHGDVELSAARRNARLEWRRDKGEQSSQRSAGSSGRVTSAPRTRRSRRLMRRRQMMHRSAGSGIVDSPPSMQSIRRAIHHASAGRRGWSSSGDDERDQKKNTQQNETKTKNKHGCSVRPARFLALLFLCGRELRLYRISAQFFKGIGADRVKRLARLPRRPRRDPRARCRD